MLPTESSISKAKVIRKENDEFPLAKYLFHTSKGYIICRKILRHGANGFTFHPMEGVLLIFMAIGRL
jgi:hypothetical protein